jgi:drug/metabolite transporter, DME family
MKPQTKGYIIGLVGITFWSTTGVFIGYLINNYHMPALLLAFWRNLLVCVVLMPALLLIRPSLLRIEKKRIGFYIFYGLLLAVFNSIWTLSVQTNGAAVATVLAYCSAGFTAILAWWIFKEQITVFKIIAIVLSLIGCVLVSNAYDPQMWNLNPLGIITGIVSGILFAVYNMLGKSAAKQNLNPWTSLLYSFAFGAVFIFLFNLIPVIPSTAGSINKIWPELAVDGWLVLIILSFIPTLLGFGLYNTSMNYLPASTVSLLATSEPALTAVEAYIFLDERMTTIQIFGTLIILVAVIIVQFDTESNNSASSVPVT